MDPITYILTRLATLRAQARDRGSITLEWMVIGAALFLAAVWAAAKIVAAIHSHANQIK
jgi:hypothetical protein